MSVWETEIKIHHLGFLSCEKPIYFWFKLQKNKSLWDFFCTKLQFGVFRCLAFHPR